MQNYPEIDPKDLGRVAVLLGGMSSEREVSLSSGSGVFNALKKSGVEVTAIDPKEVPIESLRGKFDRVVISLHGHFGEDGSVQGALEYLQIPYTGPGVMASAIAMDKVMTRRIWASCGIPVAAGITVTDENQAQEVLDTLGADVVVKPSGEGSSIGVIKLKGASVDEVREALKEALRFDKHVLVEKRIFGHELTVGILGGKALPIIEIKAPDGDYDYQNKYFTDVVRYECPANLSDTLTQKIQKACEAAFAALGARGWGRIDVMLDDSGNFVLLELNTSPGMTPHSLVPMAARAVGLSYEKLCMILASMTALDHKIAN